MQQVEIETLAAHRDVRGFLYEPLNAAQLRRYRNVHVVVSEPGAIRGNHRHVTGTETTTLAGPALVRYRCGAEVCDVVVPAGEVWRFRFPPGVAHAFRNDDVKPAVLVSFNTVEHDPASPDTVSDLLIDPTGRDRA